jgi:hypothetical protein
MNRLVLNADNQKVASSNKLQAASLSTEQLEACSLKLVAQSDSPKPLNYAQTI